MFNSPIIDSVISLIFMYLMIDILVSSIQEFVAQKKASRGKLLQFAIYEILNDRKNKNFAYLFYQNP